MRKGILSGLAGLWLLAASSAVAATADPFYVNLLGRGIADAGSGDYARAAGELRVAAFGLIDDLPRYQAAQVYLAIVSQKLGREAEARVAAEKAVNAERIASSYRQLALDPAVRAQFDTLVGKLVAQQIVAAVPSMTAPSKPQPVAPITPAPVAPVVTAAATPAPPPSTVNRQPSTISKPQPVAPIAPTPVAPVAAAAPKPTPPPSTVNRQPSTASKITAPSPAPAAPIAPPVTSRVISPPPPAPMSPLMAAAKHQPSQSAVIGNDLTPQLAAAQSLLNEGRILAARQAYLRLAQTQNLGRTQVLAVAKGLNDTSAWRESTDVYSRVSPLQRGEETHMFAEAVNRYELGDVKTARAFLQRALPALPQTREITLYRGKILGLGTP